MAVIPAIISGAKKFSGKPMEYTAKALAVATTASVIYDSHINGRERAYSLDELDSADRYYNQYKQYMTMDKESATISKMKKWWFNMQQSFPYYHIISRPYRHNISNCYHVLPPTRTQKSIHYFLVILFYYIAYDLTC